MNVALEAAAWGALVAAGLVAGGLLAARLKLTDRIAASITAFGGGVLLAAIAFELIPGADERAGVALTAGGFMAGTLVYAAADAWLTRTETAARMRRSGHAVASGHPLEPASPGGEVARGEAIAVGIFVDGVPESMALGLTIAHGSVGLALLTGILIGNVAEAYGAAQPIVAAGRSPRFAVGLLAAIGIALVGAAVLGGTVVAEAATEVAGTAQAVAAGAVLAVISISVIPYAFAKVHWGVAVASAGGFVVGYLLS